MKRFLASGVLLICLMTSQIARADEDRNAEIKAEMVQNYLLWEIALKNKDAERIISFESPDFTLTLPFQEQARNKADSDAALRSEMSLIRKVNAARAEIKKLTIEPNRVVVLSKRHHDVVAEALNTETNKPAGFFTRNTYTLTSRDIWVQYGGAWMLKRSEIQEFSGGFTSA